ncbi:MAG TPA: DNA cytosine methyltransferase [Flavisolibacter sp.]|nr:DNA cytosine methyltransferase [Sediminibacterium sp.]HJW16433.1 DNA cytosine methyltransferase [Flavisolibacter sp.]
MARKLSNIRISAENVDDALARIAKREEDPLFIIVDLFCGAGGTTTGFAKARVNGKKIAKVIACVNHDPKAIESHWENHRDVFHFEEDIRILDLEPLKKIVRYYRNLYPNAILILWASLECTNFSKAKGGQPRDADSRTLADHLHRYITAINPDYVQIENVVEFMSWGPLNEHGKPISRKNGQDWNRWRDSIKAHGYVDDWKEMNSANFGAFTSRNRLFGCFARPGLPIIWPEPTHAKKPMPGGLFDTPLQKWKAVKEVLDFSNEGKSIFNRKKPLSDKTLERIYAGLVKYVAKGDTSFISKYYSGKPSDKNIPTDGPAGTITCIDSQSLVSASFMLKYNSMSEKGVHTPPSVDDPCPVIAAQPRLGVVQLKFLSAYYGNGANCSSVEQPCPVIPTKDRFQLVSPEFFLDKHFGAAQNQSIDQPAGTILPTDKHRLIEASRFIMPTNFNNGPKSIEEPLPVITANRKRHYIINPSWQGNTGSIYEPCCVIVARQDKSPLYLVEAKEGDFAVPIYYEDSEVMIRIKIFMAHFRLSDIKMRMLLVLELLKIQGFPEKYKLAGNQSDQKKFIGNSVVPDVVKAWAEAMASGIILKLPEYKKYKKSILQAA